MGQLPNLYVVTFEDNTLYMGGKTYTDSKWLEIPNKKIKRVLYRLIDGNYLSIEGYQKYYFMVEAVKDLNGKESGKVKVQCVYIMGKRGEKITVYQIILADNTRYVRGDILRRDFNINDSNIKKLNPAGWKS